MTRHHREASLTGFTERGRISVDRSRAESVAVVIPCFEQKSFLRAAIASVAGQSVRPREIIVVDDGSSEPLHDVTSSTPGVQLIEQPNRGLAAARNAGLAASSSEKVIFLDADDRLLREAIERGLQCFEGNPDAAFVYGAFREVRGRSKVRTFCPVGSHRDLLRTNWICCCATVMFDRLKLQKLGGFDENLGMCEDWDAYLRLSRHFAFASHPALVAEYVKHDSNVSNNVETLKKWIEVVRAKEWERGLSVDDQRAWHEGEDVWRRTLDPNRRVKSPMERVARNAARRLVTALRS